MPFVFRAPKGRFRGLHARMKAMMMCVVRESCSPGASFPVVDYTVSAVRRALSNTIAPLCFFSASCAVFLHDSDLSRRLSDVAHTMQ